MPRRKKEERVVFEPLTAPVPSEAPPAPKPPDAFAEAYRAKALASISDGRMSPIRPVYCPPGIILSFRLYGGLHGAEDFMSARYEGWVPLPPELATTDEAKARAENKVALIHFEVDPDGIVRVGPYGVMFKLAEEFYRQYTEDLRRIYERQRSNEKVEVETSSAEVIEGEEGTQIIPREDALQTREF